VPLLLPGQSGDAVLHPDVRSRRAEQAGGEPGTTAERRPEGGALGVGADLEVLGFSLAQAVLDHLGQTATRELEGDQRSASVLPSRTPHVEVVA